MQRTCACGGSSGIDGLCAECRDQRLTFPLSRSGFEAPSASAVVQGNSSAQESVPSLDSVMDRASHFGHDFSQIPIYPTQRAVSQTKLKVNQPGDVFEQEADQVAEQVMRITDRGSSGEDDEDETKNPLMRKAGSQKGTHGATDTSGVSPIVHTVLNGGGGQPLDTTTRAFMEPRFGHDFSQVRVHTDARAAESARAVSALAYTVGRDVVFQQGQYAPGTSGGRRLIAHELTHTIQQGANGMFNPDVPQGPALAARGTLVQRQSDDSPDATVPDATAPDTSVQPTTSTATPSTDELDQQYQDALRLARQTGDWRNAAEKLNGFNREDIQSRLAALLSQDEIGFLHQGRTRQSERRAICPSGSTDCPWHIPSFNRTALSIGNIGSRRVLSCRCTQR